jgi:cytoskeletal protein RodZ
MILIILIVLVVIALILTYNNRYETIDSATTAGQQQNLAQSSVTNQSTAAQTSQDTSDQSISSQTTQTNTDEIQASGDQATKVYLDQQVSDPNPQTTASPASLENTPVETIILWAFLGTCLFLYCIGFSWAVYRGIKESSARSSP